MAGPGGFEITEHAADGTVTLALSGELDLQTVKELEQRVERAIAANPDSLLLDLCELSFMDSSGLRFLLVIDARARREGWRLRLAPSRHEAARLVLRMTGADSSLPFDEPQQP
jgi:anti-anti-sigma factor